jgi:hypothetical protein
MTPEEVREAAAVMLAFADGKKIQERTRSTIANSKWFPETKPDWDWASCEFRVAPEPWTGKIWVHPVNVDRAFAPNCDTDRQMMEADGWRLITVKEVGGE